MRGDLKSRTLPFFCAPAGRWHVASGDPSRNPRSRDAQHTRSRGAVATPGRSTIRLCMVAAAPLGRYTAGIPLPAVLRGSPELATRHPRLLAHAPPEHSFQLWVILNLKPAVEALVTAEVSTREQLASVATLTIWVKRGMCILPMNHGRDQSSPRLRRGRPPVPRRGNCRF